MRGSDEKWTRASFFFFLSTLDFHKDRHKSLAEKALYLRNATQRRQRLASEPSFLSSSKWQPPLPRRNRVAPRSTTSASRALTASLTMSAGRSAWAPSAAGSGTRSRGRRTVPEEQGCAGVSRYESGVGERERTRGRVFFAIRSAASKHGREFRPVALLLLRLSLALLPSFCCILFSLEHRNAFR